VKQCLGQKENKPEVKTGQERILLGCEENNDNEMPLKCKQKKEFHQKKKKKEKVVCLRAKETWRGLGTPGKGFGNEQMEAVQQSYQSRERIEKTLLARRNLKTQLA